MIDALPWLLLAAGASVLAYKALWIWAAWHDADIYRSDDQ
jgi:hypothetical protein